MLDKMITGCIMLLVEIGILFSDKIVWRDFVMNFKKLTAVLASAVAVCSLSAGAMSAAAYTEDDVLNLIQTADINGTPLAEAYYTGTMNYFAGVELDEAATTALYEDIEATIAFCESKDITSIANLAVTGTQVDAIDLTTLPMEDKEQLLAYASTMCDDIDLTFAYYPVSKKAVVTDANGATIVEITHAVKQTGSTAGVIGVSAALAAMMGACAVVAKKKKLVK